MAVLFRARRRANLNSLLRKQKTSSLRHPWALTGFAATNRSIVALYEMHE